MERQTLASARKTCRPSPAATRHLSPGMWHLSYCKAMHAMQSIINQFFCSFFFFPTIRLDSLVSLTHDDSLPSDIRPTFELLTTYSAWPNFSSSSKIIWHHHYHGRLHHRAKLSSCVRHGQTHGPSEPIHLLLYCTGTGPQWTRHPPVHHEGWMISGHETVFC
jgi:hypothetical protein